MLDFETYMYDCLADDSYLSKWNRDRSFSRSCVTVMTERLCHSVHSFPGWFWLSLNFVPQQRFCSAAYNRCMARIWMILKARSSACCTPRYFLSRTRDCRSAPSESNRGVHGWYLLIRAVRSGDGGPLIETRCHSSFPVIHQLPWCHNVHSNHRLGDRAGYMQQVMSKLVSVADLP